MIFYLAVNADHKTMIVGTQAEAKAINKDFQQIDIPVDKAGLMAWVQMMLDETINVVPEAAPAQPYVSPVEDILAASEAAEAAEEAAQQRSYAEVSTGIDELWEGLPLARRLHFVSLTVEEVRLSLPQLAL